MILCEKNKIENERKNGAIISKAIALSQFSYYVIEAKKSFGELFRTERNEQDTSEKMVNKAIALTQFSYYAIEAKKSFDELFRTERNATEQKTKKEEK